MSYILITKGNFVYLENCFFANRNCSRFVPKGGQVLVVLCMFQLHECMVYCDIVIFIKQFLER